jgi:hypothetical protein
MPEAGWLLLFLFLGVCSLIVVALLWPSFRRAQQTISTGATISPAQTVPPPRPLATTKSTPQAPKEMPLMQWLSLVNDFPDDAPHTLIVGTSGTGKTTIAQAIAATRSEYLVILDPKWKPGKWGGLPAIPIDDDGKYTQLEAAIQTLLAEMSARLVALKQGMLSFHELTIIAEELPTLITECPSASTLFKQIGRIGRELRIRLVGLSQSERVKSLGIAGEGDAIDNYTLIRLGKSAIALMSEAKMMHRPAVIEWRGEHYLIDLIGTLALATQPLSTLRSWLLVSAESGSNKQPQKQGQAGNLKQPEATDNTTIEPDIQFSADEVGRIAVMIVNGTERGKAIRAMPRYTRKQHKYYAAYYDLLKEVMTRGVTDE